MNPLKHILIITMYYVYILSNWNDTILYTGVTNDIIRRINEHKTGLNEGFTKKYNIHKLIWCEETDDVAAAIEYEKKIKGWSRKKKNDLIVKSNPTWKDLALDWGYEPVESSP